jgi:hypothetical protein
MTSEYLEYNTKLVYTPHIMTPNLLYISIFSAVLLISYIILWVLFIRQKNAWKRFMASPTGNTMDQTIAAIKQDLAKIHLREDLTDRTIENLDQRISGSTRGVGLVRYDAFSDVGGKQSFAVTLLNEQGNGVIISSMYSRARTSIYTRNITDFKTTQELTPEENQSLIEAKNNLVT